MEHKFTGHEQYIIKCWEKEHRGATEDEHINFLSFAYYVRPILHTWYEGLEQDTDITNEEQFSKMSEAFARLSPEQKQLFIEFIVPKYKQVFFNTLARRNREGVTYAPIRGSVYQLGRVLQRLTALF